MSAQEQAGQTGCACPSPGAVLRKTPGRRSAVRRSYALPASYQEQDLLEHLPLPEAQPWNGQTLPWNADLHGFQLVTHPSRRCYPVPGIFNHVVAGHAPGRTESLFPPAAGGASGCHRMPRSRSLADQSQQPSRRARSSAEVTRGSSGQGKAFPAGSGECVAAAPFRAAAFSS